MTLGKKVLAVGGATLVTTGLALAYAWYTGKKEVLDALPALFEEAKVTSTEES